MSLYIFFFVNSLEEKGKIDTSTALPSISWQPQGKEMCFKKMQAKILTQLGDRY